MLARIANLAKAHDKAASQEKALIRSGNRGWHYGLVIGDPDLASFVAHVYSSRPEARAKDDVMDLTPLDTATSPRRTRAESRSSTAEIGIS
jgi:hypothetical protein